jgi:hypothetical protein
MAAGISAGVIYALIVFLIGFMFGAVRILLLIPHLGETLSVSVEAPFFVGGELGRLLLVRGAARCVP